MRLQDRWLVATLCLLLTLLAACSGQHASSTTSQSASAAILQQAEKAALHDAQFSIAFTTDGASNVGSGTLTRSPRRFLLTLRHTLLAGQTVTLSVIAADDTGVNALFDKVSTDTMWSTPNDVEGGNYINYDTDILNYDQLSAVTLIGTETKAGQTTWHLHAQTTMRLYDQTGVSDLASGNEDLWLRQQDAFPVEIRKSVSGSGTASDGTTEHLSFQITYQFNAWNTGATVTLPDPSQISASG